MVINNENLAQSFLNKGYVILDVPGITEYLQSFNSVLLRILLNVQNDLGLPALSVSGKNSDRDLINSLLCQIAKFSPSSLTSIQRIASRVPEFFQISSSQVIASVMKCLLGLSVQTPLYMISNVLVFNFPELMSVEHVSNFSTDWHDDRFWTIPDSQYIHIWVPLLNDSSDELGALEICEGSHKVEGEHEYDFDPDALYNYRFGVKKKYIEKFTKKMLMPQFGQVLLFHQKLIHKSGVNVSKDLVRATMLGIYHNADNPKFNPGTPSLKFNKKTPEQSYYEKFNDERVRPFLREQLDESDLPPTGI